MNPEVAKKHHVVSPDLWEYNSRDAIMYALGIGCNAKNDLRYVYEGHEQFMPLPTYVVAPGLNSTHLYNWPGVEEGFDYTRVLHGEGYIEVFKPLPAEARLRNEARVIDILDKGSGALIISEVTTYNNDTNEKLAVQQVGSFQVGGGGFGGAKTSPEEIPIAAIPDRAPDAIIEENINSEQGTFYRVGSMDMNPIHINPEMSVLSGFKIPILHGLCTFGFAFRHILNTWAENNAELFQAVKLRFTTPVIPGQTLMTETWKEGNRIIFRVKVKETGKIAINNSWIRFSKISEVPSVKHEAKL